MTPANAIKRGREASQQEKWDEAYTFLSTANQQTDLEAEDLVLLAKAAFLIGKESQGTDIWTKAHQQFLNRNKIPQAANCAFWIGMILFNQGEGAQGSGWMARAKRLLKEQPECAEHGFLLIPNGLQQLRKGDGEGAQTIFHKAYKIGSSFDNPDLMTLGQLGRGQALIMQNKTSRGTTLLDEAMVAVISNQTSPLVSGIVYCAVIETCQKIYDLQRAQEWTAALSRWCDSHPELIPFRGQCLVRRAEIMQLHGDWSTASSEVEKACKVLAEPPGDPAAGEAFYLQAELHRLQGNFSQALEMYRQSSKWGRKPQPGLALLRLMQGKIDVAKAAIRQLEKEKKDPLSRSKILPAYVTIMLAADEITATQNAASELVDLALKLKAPFLEAVSLHTEASVLYATGKIRPALEKLRKAWTIFNDIEATYEGARTRMLIGRACLKLGDKDTADMEVEAARWTFHQLGAVPDLERLDSFLKDDANHVHGLTSREQEVLKILATGKTNKEIAANLYISERTVDRHVSNILSKLEVPSRAAATAYAYEHKLV